MTSDITYPDNHTRELVAEVFDGAVHLLETEGWRQGPREVNDNRSCAIIAMMDASARVFDRNRRISHRARLMWMAETELRKTIQSLGIVIWNDHHRRTKEEVVQAMEETARRLRSSRDAA